jgi:hypothetical protein
VIEMTLVGMYADTSFACVSMIGSAVRQLCRCPFNETGRLGLQPETSFPVELEEALALFETSHPNLTLILEQLIDTLAGMGL